MRTFKIYILGNFQIYTTVLATITRPGSTTPELIYFTTGSSYFGTPSPIPPPASDNRQAVSCVWEDLIIFFNVQRKKNENQREKERDPWQSPMASTHIRGMETP